MRYLVTDDGWAECPGKQFQQNGDWHMNRRAFPQAGARRPMGFACADSCLTIWLEFEAVNSGSAAWHETAHRLYRDGAPLQAGTAASGIFRDPSVHEFPR